MQISGCQSEDGFAAHGQERTPMGDRTFYSMDIVDVT